MQLDRGQGNRSQLRNRRDRDPTVWPGPTGDSPPRETRDCQSGFYLLNFLESGVHGHSGSNDIALNVREQIAGLVPLIDGEFSRG